MGYWCRKKYQNQGYITEAVDGITNFPFDKLGAKRVEIRCNEGNELSVKISKKLGFELEGILRNVRVNRGGTLGNELVFAKVR